MQTMTQPLQPPWWKEPMIWLVAGLPALAVVASFITYFIAASDPDPLVNAGYRKEGLAPLQDTDKERRAAALKVQADLAYANGEASIKLYGLLDKQPASLELLLLHPTDADQDVRLLLTKIAVGRYAAPALAASAGKRQWILEPDDQTWRLTGSLTMPLTGTLKLANDSLLNPP
jgi:hypothetical protein